MQSVSFLFSTLILLSFTANADFRKIAETGQQAAYFPVGFNYSGFSYPVIGDGGHIALAGRAVSSTTSLSAIWSGKPDQLKTVIKKGDIVNEFPVNSIFVNSSSRIVSDSGSIAFEGGMVDSENSVYFYPLEIFSGSYLASVNGSVVGVIQRDGHAPGFSAETTVQSLDKYLFTDAGMAIHGKTSSFQDTIWFWNNNIMERIVTRGDANTNFFPGCFVIQPYLIDLNQNGELLFGTEFATNVIINCPKAGLFTWKNGIFRTVAVDETALPDSLGYISPSVLESSKSGSINDSGDVLFFGNFVIQSNPQISNTGTFIASDNGDIEFIMLSGEEVPIEPYGPNRFILPSKISASNAFGQTVGRALWDGGEIILSGGSQPITILNTTPPGESHLTVLAYNRMPVPGLDPIWSFASQKFSPPIINNQGSIVFSNTVSDGIGVNFFGIWKRDSNGDLNLVIADGIPIVLDGVSQTLDNIKDLVTYQSVFDLRTAASTNSGTPSSFNDLNQLVLSGRYAGTFDQVIFLYEDNSNKVLPIIYNLLLF